MMDEATRDAGCASRVTYAALWDWENLRLAYGYAARGKRGKQATAAFEYRLADHLLELQEELATKTYQPGAYYSFYIHDPKRRLISAAPFRDRVVHHALCNLMEPLFERSFIHDSYANRVGKGTHRALDRAQVSYNSPHPARNVVWLRQCPELAEGWAAEALRDGATVPWPSRAS
jgi:retron-type reverse transcriptase